MSTAPRSTHFALAVLASIFAATGAHASGNLLVNGDAEAGPGLTTGEVVPVPGWTLVAGNFTVINYGPEYGGPDVTSPGPLDRGLNYFAGGNSIDFSAATQTVDLTAYQAYFSSHPFTFTLSGWFGGYSSQNDHADVSVSFRDSGNNEIEFASLQGSDALARNDVTGLLFASTGWTAANNVNINPAYAVVTLSMTRTDGADNDGYADNLLFSVDAVPEPGSLALMLAGIGVVGLVRRSRVR
jgi:hypothetical protein